MMGDINITATIAQMPNVQGMAGAQLAHPEAQQVFAAQMAQQTLKDQHDQVQKIEKKEGAETVKDEDDQRRGGKRHMGGQRRARERETPEDPEAGAPNASPWLGHLVNRKV